VGGYTDADWLPENSILIILVNSPTNPSGSFMHAASLPHKFTPPLTVRGLLSNAVSLAIHHDEGFLGVLA
jgi:hypothetical protein